MFLSFAAEDLNQVNLLRGQARNEESELRFDDYSVKVPFDSKDADYIRRQIRERLQQCSVTVVFLSKASANSAWVNWEVEESIKLGKGVIGVYEGKSAPASIPAAFVRHGLKCVPWKQAELTRAIEDARRKKR